ncbi:hypothetical protein [Legionella septentrionalis]|uniref:Uncharacterized protein n=1 Tax=Legionella septentrionalis TaxID=2498109 RepID=A0A433JLK3_9GAMM|nr:hypothetical protein [Legionella septentrionalis]RUQ90392.1 hypothetical protein EKM59_01940 [Legionella septentrionalis]
MNKKVQKALEQLLPFILLGMAIAFAVGVLIMFSYVLIWGILIGTVIWTAVLLKNYFFPKKTPITTKPQGRIIEHEHDNH